MVDLWSKSQRESGVKFDIQQDATNKKFQQPKYDALTNCDTEHVTDNLVSTVSQNLKSYLEAAKENLSDTNNNKTFPIRPTLEQVVAVNEGVPTAESTAALEVVPTSELPVINEDVQTDESPTEVVGVPSAESPTPRKSRDKQAIRRNARNLLVTSRHMSNGGDEIQVNSLSPSNIDIQNSRRITLSFNPVNEGAQSSTSMP